MYLTCSYPIRVGHSYLSKNILPIGIVLPHFRQNDLCFAKPRRWMRLHPAPRLNVAPPCAVVIMLWRLSHRYNFGVTTVAML